MLNPYRELLSTPGAKAFVFAGFIARLPMAMSAIGIITMLSQLRGSFSLASTVAGTFVLCSAFVAPQISRLVDRHGQGKVLPLAALSSATGLLSLAACTYWHAPDWTLYLFALLAGCKPSMPAMVRSRWTTLLGSTKRLHTAYALESVLDEACFIVGPPLAVGLSVAAFAQAGPMAAAFLLILGVLLFTAQRRTEPPIRSQVAGAPREGSVVMLPSVQALALVMLGLGAINGAIDVTSVAFAKRSGEPATASLVLSAYAAGSFVAGLLFGVAKHNIPLLRLLLGGGVATVASTLLLMFASSIFSLSVVMLISGLSVAPTMIVAMILVEKNVPSRRLTEALTWLITGLNVGISAGAVCAGQIVDNYPSNFGFGVAVVAGIVTLLAACHAGRRVIADMASSCQ